MVKVDAMEPEESVRLVSNNFDEPLCRGNGCFALVEEVTQCLDRLALAMDLAGALVQADVENGHDLATALPNISLTTGAARKGCFEARSVHE
jgi:hypothetical protein